MLGGDVILLGRGIFIDSLLLTVYFEVVRECMGQRAAGILVL